jgi:hypothetical protein
LSLRRDGAYQFTTLATPRTVDLELFMGHADVAAFSAVFASNYTVAPTQVLRRRSVNLPDFTAHQGLPAPWSLDFPFDAPFPNVAHADFAWELRLHGNSNPNFYPLDAYDGRARSTGNTIPRGTGCIATGGTVPMLLQGSTAATRGSPSWSVATAVCAPAAGAATAPSSQVAAAGGGARRGSTSSTSRGAPGAAAQVTASGCQPAADAVTARGPGASPASTNVPPAPVTADARSCSAPSSTATSAPATGAPSGVRTRPRGVAPAASATSTRAVAPGTTSTTAAAGALAGSRTVTRSVPAGRPAAAKQPAASVRTCTGGPVQVGRRCGRKRACARRRRA